MIAAGAIRTRDQPTLATRGAATLRRWEAGDQQELIDAFADPEIQRWHFLRIDSPEEAEEWIVQTWEGWQAETVATWAISADGRPDAVGRISLYFHDLRNGLGEISYWISPKARGTGLCTSALGAVATWAFDELGMHRVEVVHSVANPTSCRVASKAGFEAEGTRSSALLHPDGWHDMHVHQRIAPT